MKRVFLLFKAAFAMAMLDLIYNVRLASFVIMLPKQRLGKGKVHPCTGTEALYRPYGP